MIKHSEKILAGLGILAVIGLAQGAKAMTSGECEQLSGNMYLAAIERGECDIGIETAAGPQPTASTETDSVPGEDGDGGDEGDGGGNRDGRNGGEGGGGGGGGRGGGDGGRDSSGGSRGTATR
jgi:uncharacterized membrane protein YgcG